VLVSTSIIARPQSSLGSELDEATPSFAAPTYRPRALDVSLELLLQIIDDWSGTPVRLAVDVAGQPAAEPVNGILLHVRDSNVADDDCTRRFTVGGNQGFCIDRNCFAGAHVFPDSGHMIVVLVHETGDSQRAASTVVHVMGAARPSSV
jgi:hypothetical protein